MSNTVFLCEQGLPADGHLHIPRESEVQRLCLDEPGRNINRELNPLEAKIVEDLDPLVFDLFDLATYLYIGDTSVGRGQIDVYGDKWCRDLTFRVPVREFEKWNDSSVRERLNELLTYLSGDWRVRVEFYAHKDPKAPPKFLRFQPDMPGFQGATTVSLFSGGMDSLGGAVHQIANLKEKPLLVSHRPVSTIVTRQEAAAKAVASSGKSDPLNSRNSEPFEKSGKN